MEKRILIFLMILLINLSILFGTILLKYFGFNILNLKLFFPGTILFLFSFFSYLGFLHQYENLYIWVKIGKIENLEENDEKINNYLSEFFLYIITTHSFTVILIIYLKLLWNQIISRYLLILILSIILGHQASYPMGKSILSDINHTFLCFIRCFQYFIFNIILYHINTNIIIIMFT